jgi:hypothetical protein
VFSTDDLVSCRGLLAACGPYGEDKNVNAEMAVELLGEGD